MVVSLQTLIDRSVRNMGSGINPRVKEYAVELVKRAYSKGIYVQITSGFRSNAEQTRLYNQGRTTPGNIVTHAEAGESIHNYGLAIDYALLTSSGVMHWDINKDMNSNNARDWFEVASIGKALGFAWGGDWKKFKDYPHLDMQKGYSLASLASGKRPNIPPLKNVTPVKAPDKGYLTYDDRGDDVKVLQSYLTKVGFPVAVSGYFNAETRRAVMDFQKSRGLKDDGIYGTASEKEMLEALSEARKPVVKPASPAPVPVKEEEDEKLELTPRQREEIAENFRIAKARGVFSSDDHVKDILEGTMTISRLLYLNNVIASAALVGGKRANQN